jgi:hypothetical protein
MSRPISPGIAAAALGALLAAAPAQAVQIVGLTSTNALVTFDSATPMNASAPVTISGLTGPNERIVAIDLRPRTGLLYGVSDASKVYVISAGGTASFVSALSVPLTSSVVSIDFNPAADLSGATSLRIVGGSGQNLAYNANSGATTVATAVQSGIAAVAYANNDLNAATATALYYVDAASDLLKVATTGFNNPTINTVGALGFDANGVSGFDIFGASTGYAAMMDADTGKTGLYGIDLATGAASFVGSFGIGGSSAIAPSLAGLTVAAVVPEPQALALMLTGLAAVGFMARRRARG